MYLLQNLHDYLRENWIKKMLLGIICGNNQCAFVPRDPCSFRGGDFLAYWLLARVSIVLGVHFYGSGQYCGMGILRSCPSFGRLLHLRTTWVSSLLFATAGDKETDTTCISCRINNLETIISQFISLSSIT
jgi:hypothetical protein